MGSRRVIPWLLGAAFALGLLVGCAATVITAPLTQVVADETTARDDGEALTWKSNGETLVLQATQPNTAYFVVGTLASEEAWEELGGRALAHSDDRLEIAASEVSELLVYQLIPKVQVKEGVFRPCGDNPLIDCPIPRPPPPPWGFGRLIEGSSGSP
ncbi:MAG: hypothetical protein AAGD01_19185 [Acidobacteriota bacterium]